MQLLPIEQESKLKIIMSFGNMKYYKIVHGFNDNLQYFPITSDELHKAFVIAMEGGKAIFENGFFNNRSNDILRIVPDWHKVKNWNKGYEMTALDFEDVKPLEESYRNTLSNGKLLAEYIVKENKRELLSNPASESFKQIKQLVNPEYKQFSEVTKSLADKFKM